MIKSVIFDMDGVLVNNAEAHIAAFAEWCARHNVKLDNKVLRGLFGMGNDDIFKVILNDENLPEELIEEYSQEKEDIYRKIFAETIEPMPGLVNLLKGLKALGIKLAVGSSGMRKNVDFVLEKCGIAGYFDAISDGDMITRAKPDPEVFLLAASLLGTDPAENIVVEDSFAGIEAARRAGMKVVAVATTFPREKHKDYDLLINDFTEVDADSLLKFSVV